ncbi:glycosyltransferase family 2 protein [Leifsonia sp. NPDC058230]|uniref:glycosyltransferase family 2 protein n=1 Tax=Leifsonia sp. NPDC058230 TaxID=3346391 RepID=UPI0036DA3941
MTVTEHPPRASGVLVVVVTYNNAEHLDALLQSILAQDIAVPARTVVVDNGSSDETVAIARREGVTVIETGENLGYSGAINVARGQLRPGEALAVLNPDLVVSAGAFDRLLTALDDQTVGIAVPQLRNGDGSLYTSLHTEPTVINALGEALFGAHLANRPHWLGDTLRRADDYARDRDVAWASGAALLVAPDCDAQVGSWDSETYFLYSEEMDYARRTRDAGYRIRYLPEAEAIHIGGGSGRSPRLAALLEVNRIRYFSAHHSRLATALFRSAVALQYLARSWKRENQFVARVVCTRSLWATLPPALEPQQQPAAPAAPPMPTA